MDKVRDLLDAKGHAVHAIAPDASVLDAIRRMAEHGVGALVVMRGETLVGVVSERDYARKVALQGRTSAGTAVAEVMSAPVVTIDPDTDILACMHLCTHARTRHLPVVDGERVIGVISLGDLVKAVIDSQAEQIEQLERYITG